jgi:mannose/fructose/N-acetylgalactosamine-specific phosphotransferase system component IID/mannose/fructose/N-acetylgalactosamine-specific phosphotransferase system component IIC
MTLSLIGCFGLAAFIACVMLEGYGYGYWMISRPVIGGALVGLMMGDVRTGLLVGGSVELMFMGVLPIGGAVPPNAPLAGMIGTAFAIMAGGKPEVGIALALPVGLLGQFMVMLGWNINIYWEHRADRYIALGDTRNVEITHMMGLVVWFCLHFLVAFAAVRFGGPGVAKLVAHIPAWLSTGLKAASAILPAVGMAMLMRMMNAGKYWPFLLAGLVAAVSLHLDVLSIALIGLAIAVGMLVLGSPQEKSGTSASEQLAETTEKPMLDRKDLWGIWWRSLFSMTTINYERFCALGFCYAMIPALKKYYPNKDDYKEALARSNEFYNCHPFTGNLVMGVNLALEEEKSKTGLVTPETISSTKAALMGPLSGIGDSLFKATFMTIFAAIGAGMCLQGNWFGPIVFIVPNVLLNIFSRWYFLADGYKYGIKLVARIQESRLTERFLQAATIIGLMVTGAMIISFVSLPLVLTFTSGGKTIAIQDLLDKLYPSLLPVAITLIYYKILGKTSRSGIYWCIFLSFAIGILGKLFHVL